MSLCYPTDRPACTLPSHQLPALPIIIPSALLSCVYYRSSYSHSSPAHTVHHHTLFISPLHVAQSYQPHFSPAHTGYCHTICTPHLHILPILATYCPIHYFQQSSIHIPLLHYPNLCILPPPLSSLLFCTYCPL